MTKTSIEQIISARPRDLGGFEVRRVLPFAKRRMVGPFIFFDQIGPARFDAGHGIDVRPHPHIGLATVTYLFEGALRHRDSLGVDQVIRPGDVNWMTAGRGVVHSERTPDLERSEGHTLYGIQTWVALPDGQEEIDAAFSHLPERELPSFFRDEVRYRLILGSAWEHTSPVEVHSPIVYLHAEMPAGTTTRIDLPDEERAIYLVEGSVRIDDQPMETGSLAVLRSDSVARVEADQGSTLMICGGASIGPRLVDWNFVASSRNLIDAARQDWKRAGENDFPADGRFRMPEGEDEFIPLPDDETSRAARPSPGLPTS
ncbi:pirin family protein [Maricaulis sp. CAU 1757]